jgi:hypothetical protein
VHGSALDGAIVAVFVRDGRLTGVLAFNCGPEFAGYQRLIGSPLPVEAGGGQPVIQR